MYDKEKTLAEKIQHISFESLLPFDQEQNYLKLMREISTGIIECKNPNDQINYINELRRMRKYHSDLFEAIFSNILSYYIINLIKSSNVEICINSLILISEIFSYYDYTSQKNQWIPHLLPLVIELSTSNNEIIKKHSYIGLNNLANNMFYQETLNTLLELIIESDKPNSENACDTLIMFINFMDEVNLLNAMDWSDPCNYLSEMLQSRRPDLVEKGKILLHRLILKFGNDFNIFINFFTEEQRRLIEDSMVQFEYKTKTNKIEEILG